MVIAGVLAGLTAVCAGVLLWPSRWADPRRLEWREHARARTPTAAQQSPASDVALAALLLVVALRTGLPVVLAVERVAAQLRADLAADLLTVVTAYERGLDEGCDPWAGLPEIWQPVAAAMAVAHQAGVAPGSLLQTAADAIARRESVAQESAIGRVSIALVLPLGLVLLPAFMGTTVLPLLLVMTQQQLAP